MAGSNTEAANPATETDAKPLPMCSDCHRPLGLFYAECRTCFARADLHDEFYFQWGEWLDQQAAARQAARLGAERPDCTVTDTAARSIEQPRR